MLIFSVLYLYTVCMFAHMTIREYFSCYHFNLISVFQMFGPQRRELFGLSSTDSRNPIGCSVRVTRRSLVNTEHFSDSRNPISCWVLETRRSLVNTKNFPGKSAPLVQCATLKLVNLCQRRKLCLFCGGKFCRTWSLLKLMILLSCYYYIHLKLFLIINCWTHHL